VVLKAEQLAGKRECYSQHLRIQKQDREWEDLPAEVVLEEEERRRKGGSEKTQRRKVMDQAHALLGARKNMLTISSRDVLSDAWLDARCDTKDYTNTPIDSASALPHTHTSLY